MSPRSCPLGDGFKLEAGGARSRLREMRSRSLKINLSPSQQEQ
ncbi:MAG: hypothetical protein SW833_04860 [Cyanobacteriota bacterium]|nr:hypothetical protein [Cyanobacteriota bacterium]